MFKYLFEVFTIFKNNSNLTILNDNSRENLKYFKSEVILFCQRIVFKKYIYTIDTMEQKRRFFKHGKYTSIIYVNCKLLKHIYSYD